MRGIIVNSHLVRHQILEYYSTSPAKIHVIHNGVEWQEMENDFKASFISKPQIAKQLGFEIRGLERSFREQAVEIRRVSKVVGEDILSLDLLLVTPQVEDVWESRHNVKFEGRALSVVSRDGLIKLKTLAGRPQDIADIHRIENEKD